MQYRNIQTISSNRNPPTVENLMLDIHKYVRLSDTEKVMVSSRLKVRTYKKKAHIFEAGTVIMEMYFVSSGIICLFGIDDKGIRHALQFGIPGWWLTDVASFENASSSEYHLECAEKCELIAISRVDYQFLMDHVPAFEKYFRLILQKKYAASVKKIELLMCESAEERFHKFNIAFPNFVQKVPQYVLASVLALPHNSLVCLGQG